HPFWLPPRRYASRPRLHQRASWPPLPEVRALRRPFSRLSRRQPSVWPRPLGARAPLPLSFREPLHPPPPVVAVAGHQIGGLRLSSSPTRARLPLHQEKAGL